jgi:hypothetical protein
VVVAADPGAGVWRWHQIMLEVCLTPVACKCTSSACSQQLVCMHPPPCAAGTTTTAMKNLVMQLRKCCNHPYLFQGADPGEGGRSEQGPCVCSAKSITS